MSTKTDRKSKKELSLFYLLVSFARPSKNTNIQISTEFVEYMIKQNVKVTIRDKK